MPKSALPFNDGELQQEAAVNFDKDMILDLMFYALGSLTLPFPAQSLRQMYMVS
jgi:hypothetical protein